MRIYHFDECEALSCTTTCETFQRIDHSYLHPFALAPEIVDHDLRRRLSDIFLILTLTNTVGIVVSSKMISWSGYDFVHTLLKHLTGSDDKNVTFMTYYYNCVYLRNRPMMSLKREAIPSEESISRIHGRSHSSLTLLGGIFTLKLTCGVKADVRIINSHQ